MQEPLTDICNVMLVDDHPVFRLGLRKLLDDQPDIHVQSETETSQEALELLKEEAVDLLIADLSLPEASGLDLIKKVRATYPGLPVLVISMHDENLFAERSLKAGAHGFVMKTEAPKKILEAIRKTVKSEIVLSKKQSQFILTKALQGEAPKEQASQLGVLSDRELEVFEKLGQGKMTKEIAKMLHISVKTVETHQSHIKKKLNLSNYNELLRAAVAWATKL
ncbi:MAG: response regulator transcription factor [Myxococcota bacterium]|nr:response regulator transcription factor [Myxococcota bacterium]